MGYIASTPLDNFFQTANSGAEQHSYISQPYEDSHYVSNGAGMLKIRLQRIGRANDPSYRVVVTEHTNGPKAGKEVEKVGSYNPKTKVRVLDAERIKYWLSVGAQASGTMHNMLISANIITGKKVNVLPKKTVPPVSTEGQAEVGKKEEVVAEAAPAAAPLAEAPEQSAEEVTQDDAAAESVSAEQTGSSQ
jgi:small subunit ribosomal protein S16